MAFPILAYINTGNLSLSQSVLTHELLSSSNSADSPRNVLQIRCKYYHARITVQEILNEQDVNGVEAAIVFFDADKDSSWQEAQRWMDAIGRLDIPLRLLVCHHIPAKSHSHIGVVHKQPAYHRVAVDKEFELIELEPHPDDIEEGEEFGVQRIKSALEAHMWPNMKLLDDPLSKYAEHPLIPRLNHTEKHCCDAVRNEILPSGTADQSVSHEGCDLLALIKDERPTRNKQMNSSDCREIQTVSENKSDQREPDGSPDEDKKEELLDEQSFDSFERAFRAVMTTRERIGNLDHNTRRKVAEKLTLQLWRAVGGSLDEIDGLSEASSNEDQ
ncbi:hypothetical protein FGIG_08358 [Fasciola gigantica]|uniref:Alpha-and gamma-adaptin-binding protein p34 n=1 Tax=Fasciola gigantica TaxID=46835 RepID=A0A504YUF5_FASGI|nr:hypothetical protein FGIG_08358 [Fasciola gigantica]